jgi:hypothetical protein
MSVEIVLFVCLIAAPTDCKPVILPFEGPLAVCNRVSMIEVAGWIGDHPKYRVSRWWCRDQEIPT